ncbi:prothoracicostatic peptides [Euwallacea fornicatus]|uniref:prothoracicostatic peptides n=1 Tax=Euwallacea fornicatus TaxID=995702 RepID=UPI00338FE94B
MIPGKWSSAFKGPYEMFLYIMAFAVCLEALVLVGANDLPIPPRKSLEENPQLENDEYSKRGWKTDLPMWGKRGWNNLHSGWGKRDSNSEEDDGLAQAMDKRAWQRLQGGWGKRFVPYNDDDAVLRQLAAALDEDVSDNNIDYPDQELDLPHEVNKRNWRSLNEGWGKRSNKWDKFRGSWGKRQPAWNNLKGLWGKRSVAE